MLFTGDLGGKGDPGEPGINGLKGVPGLDATQEACSGEKVRLVSEACISVNWGSEGQKIC